ncbi:MAG: acyl-CoA thioesterase II [Pseudomonadota bacterium]
MSEDAAHGDKKLHLDRQALKFVLAALDLEKLEENLFRGPSIHTDWRRVFGGQVLGQALSAAIKTVEADRHAHSLHAYFLLPGDPQAPIVYEVENLRDGGSFSTRRVKAIQHGKVIFVMSVSLQVREEGLTHTARAPEVPPPEDLTGIRELALAHEGELPPALVKYLTGPQPIDVRPIDLSRYTQRTPREPVEHMWLRARDRLPDTDAVHASLLAYVSDFTLLQTALLGHGRLMTDPEIQLASLDHAMWFHRPFRADEWILYSMDSPNAGGARGFSRGQFFTKDGLLIASTAQEGLMRVRRPRDSPQSKRN